MTHSVGSSVTSPVGLSATSPDPSVTSPGPSATSPGPSVTSPGPSVTSPVYLRDCPLLCVVAASNGALLDTYMSGVEDPTEYRGDQLARLLPAARFPADSVAGLDPSAGLLHADRCLAAVRRLFVADGGQVRDGAPVSGISPIPGSGGRLLRLSVSGGSQPAVTCRGLVVCAGPWAGPLLAPLGLPRLQRLLQPQTVAVTYWRLRPGASLPLAGIDLGATPSDRHFYWLPSMEYPGMVKVNERLGLTGQSQVRELLEEGAKTVVVFRCAPSQQLRTAKRS